MAISMRKRIKDIGRKRAGIRKRVLWAMGMILMVCPAAAQQDSLELVTPENIEADTITTTESGSVNKSRWGEVRSHYIVDEVIAAVGNDHILLSDLERTTKEVEAARRREGGTLKQQTPREEAFESLLLRKLLAECGRSDSLNKDMRQVSDLQIQLAIDQEVAELGSVKALEKKYGKEIFSIKEDMKKEYEEINLAQAMQGKVVEDVVVNYPEVKIFYDSLPLDSMEMVPEQYIYAQIVRTPPQTEERKFEVKQTLLNFRQRILEGKDRFGALARMYSMDEESRRKGGEWGPDDINKLVYPMVEALENLKPGKVSEIVETEYGYHLVELISLKGDIVHFRHILMKPAFTVEETERELKLLDSVAKAVGTDRKLFEEAVVKYSEDAETRENGGVVFNSDYGRMMFDPKYASSRFMIDMLKPTDYIPLSKLQVGEVSTPYSAINEKNGDVIYKIVRLNEVIPSHPASLEGDYEIIADMALNNKQGIELEAWLKRAIVDMYIWISPEYRDLKLEYNWLKE